MEIVQRQMLIKKPDLIGVYLIPSDLKDVIKDNEEKYFAPHNRADMIENILLNMYQSGLMQVGYNAIFYE